MVGIFFFVGCELIIDAVPLEYGEMYGDTIQHGSHYDYWQYFIPTNEAEIALKERAYDAYPRGRVIFFPKQEYYRLYADRCLIDEQIRMVIQTFKLENVTISRDEHYKCARCNPEFVE